MRGNALMMLAAIMAEGSFGYADFPGIPMRRRTISDELGIDLETEYRLIQAKRSKLSHRTLHPVPAVG